MPIFNEWLKKNKGIFAVAHSPLHPPPPFLTSSKYSFDLNSAHAVCMLALCCLFRVYKFWSGRFCHKKKSKKSNLVFVVVAAKESFFECGKKVFCWKKRFSWNLHFRNWAVCQRQIDTNFASTFLGRKTKHHFLSLSLSLWFAKVVDIIKDLRGIKYNSRVTLYLQCYSIIFELF